MYERDVPTAERTSSDHWGSPGPLKLGYAARYTADSLAHCPGMSATKERLRFHRLVSAIESHLDGGQSQAWNATHAVLHAWQRHSYPILVDSRSAPWGTGRFLKLREVVEFAEWLAAGELIESAYWLASAYARWVGPETRLTQSLFFTPPFLAERLIDRMLQAGASLSRQTWHDPACGGAAFLVPVAVRMRAELTAAGVRPKDIFSHVVTHISGNDLNPVLLRLSGQFLRMALAGLDDGDSSPTLFALTCGDGLVQAHPTRRFDVVLCNPPYRKLSRLEAAKYMRSYGDVMDGQPNIYGLFVSRCLSLVEDSGLLGLVTPTSYLSGQNFSKVRTSILERYDVKYLDIVGPKKSVFLGVQQETASAVLKMTARPQRQASETVVALCTNDRRFTGIGRCLLPNSGRPWPIPREPADVGLLPVLASVQSTLRDYGYVARIGGVYAHRDPRRRYRKYPSVVTKGRVIPLVWSTDVGSEGQFVHARDTRFAKGQCYIRVASLSEPGVVSRPSALLQRVTSSDQTRRLVASAVPASLLREHGGFVAENHVVVLERVTERGWEPDFIAQVLGTRVMDRLFRMISAASNVSLYELDALPLPNPDRLRVALATGMSTDAAVVSAFGLPPEGGAGT
jgi:adenine-specific DNA-methyltransferase